MIPTTAPEKIRVVVVDDCVAARRVIISQLSCDSGIVVAGEAGNGLEALKMVLDLKPDLVTIDMEMPVMGGLSAIEQIMARSPVPILVLTARDDADAAFSALAKGALEVLEKPRADRLGTSLARKIRMLAGVSLASHLRKDRNPQGSLSRLSRTPSPRVSLRGVVAIASSTGGPKALSVILSSLPPDLPAPILIAQHMSEGFTEGMANWLNMNSRLAVHIATEGTAIVPGNVYISPSERNMRVGLDGMLLLEERQLNEIYRPSCDHLLSSVARVYGKRSIGVILTGMGSDGSLGMARIRAAGGATIAQDERSSVIFGMPKAAIDSGCIDLVLPLDKISAELVKRLWITFSVTTTGPGAN
ncbi:MAG: chemotaxis-specific protein-glutamate methyltransferase CheB [Geobacteraceae bacterium]|nr:chemotaxis-specific protein-glutamate methyltransferase CheB [Geobacteraceae bacterium]